MHETGGVLELVALVCGALFLASALAVIAKRLRVPLSIGLLFAGAGFGVAASAAHGTEGWAATLLAPVANLEISPDAILFVFLPTLIFQSAIHLDVRRLARNIVPILVLAIPGLLISTAVVGGIMSWSVGLALPVALLFGAMVSATDPVAVISIFEEVGAPKRLVTLVEGESLFNDATAIVLFGLILDVIGGMTSTPGAILGHFLYVFVGGAVVGLGVGWAFSVVLGWVDNVRVIEITLTTVLAYVSFVLADHVLHVSGVMSTVAAGLVLGSFGRTKISPPVTEFMHEFWSYAAWVANALLFLLLGVSLPEAVGVSGLATVAGPILLAWAAAHLARVPAVFGLVPLLPRLRLAERVGRGYQVIMFWGGLRGAIAVALGLSLVGNPALDGATVELILSLTAGLVALTLLVNGLSMRSVVGHFGLDQESPADRHLRAGSMVEVEEEVLDTLGSFRRHGLIPPRVLEELDGEARRRREEQLAVLEGEELDVTDELVVHATQAIGVEVGCYLRLFAEGNVSEPVTRELISSCEARRDEIRKGRSAVLDHEPIRLSWSSRMLRLLPFGGRLADRAVVARVAMRYEAARARYLAAEEVLELVNEMADSGALDRTVREELDACYRAVLGAMSEAMDEIADQFPEYTSKVQSLVGHRLVIATERRGYDRLLEEGVITPEIHDRLATELDGRLRALRRRPVDELALDPQSLLAGVPIFRELAPDVLGLVVERLTPRTCDRGEVLFRAGDTGDRMFLIGRGVVKVWTEHAGDQALVATLGAGDFVGEMACLRQVPRTATVTTATVARLFELRARDLQDLMSRYDSVAEVIERADRKRREELDRLTVET